jgi:hypothetical protein
MLYINSIGHYSALTKKEILPFVAATIILEDLMLNEYASHKKTSTIGLHLYKVSKIPKGLLILKILF